MRKLLILFFFSGSLILNSCNYFLTDDYKLKVRNNTGTNIYSIYSRDYPDTTFRIAPKPVEEDLIKSHSERHLISRTSWESVFNSLPADTLSIFIFDAHLIDNTPWDTVKSKYLILKRYDLSYDDLVRMNWTVIYP